MNISVKGEYALQALFDLSLQNPGEPVKIADIARRQKIPQKFLELILAGLKQAGFVESKRGAEGGYLLARPADSITVGQVIRYTESRKPGRAATRHDPGSPFCDMWREVEHAVSHVVDTTSFGDLTRRWREREGSYVPTWDI
ncbi:MAG TPA: Rrf2 family transcriptional regulator [Bryobacteraceae bacterium]|nr:Rrf2 family transcriptional regulator [Bryobacteraceae bacterium]